MTNSINSDSKSLKWEPLDGTVTRNASESTGEESINSRE